MSRVTTLQERSEMMRLAQAGISDKEIEQHLNWSAATIRKWRRRGQKSGTSIKPCKADGLFSIRNWVAARSITNPLSG